MGCPCELILAADDAALRARAGQAVQAEVQRLEDKYSHFRADSYLAGINRSAASGATIRVDDETADLLDFAAAVHRESGGVFDITAGALTRLWDLRSGRLPEAGRVAAALSAVGWHKVVWSRPSLTLPLGDMALDLGGVVKEYAADRAAAECRALGVEHGLVDLGGDLSVIGPRPDAQAWSVGIRDPRRAGGIAARIGLAAGGLATSGDYERCLIVDGQRYSHIIDPRDGQPVRGLASVTALAPSCLVAGAASTVAMLLDAAAAIRWLAELGLPHLWIADDGSSGGSISAQP